MKPFKSFLAPHLEEYMAYRIGLGYAQHPQRHILVVFDRYLRKQNVTWDQLQPSFFLKLRAQISAHPTTVNDTLTYVRGFFRFLVRKGLIDQNPVKDIPKLPKRHFVPFVFSEIQTQVLIETVGKNIRKKEKFYLLDRGITMALVMLARCGMRINEPLHLERGHYRKAERTVYIERTKFRKDRLIPLPKAVFDELERYLSLRRTLCAHDQNPYLLAGRGRDAIKDQDIRFAFHRAVRQMGLSRPKQVIGNVAFGSPVPHSLRHSFAINTLNRIKTRGQCPQHALPVLAAYMGHRKYQYTGAYLKVKDAHHRTGLLEFVKSRAVVK
jgi:site-specific recombinase XerD